MVNEDKIKEIQGLINQDVKNITYEGQMTIIEFENGEILPLYGGIAGIEDTKQTIRSCSFCGTLGSSKKPVVSLNDKNDPLICPDCATTAIKTLVENGIEIEIDLSNLVSNELIEQLIDKNKE